MKLIKKTEGVEYQAVDHFNMWGALKIKEGISKRTVVSLSHFLPDGGAKMKPSARERLYFVITGSITVTGETGEEFKCDEGDAIYIPPNEARSMSVNNNLPATILVVVVRVE